MASCVYVRCMMAWEVIMLHRNSFCNSYVRLPKWKPTENNKLEASSILASSQYHHLMISSFHKLCHGTVFFCVVVHITPALWPWPGSLWILEKMMRHGSGRNHGQSWRNLKILKPSEVPTTVARNNCSHESTTCYM